MANATAPLGVRITEMLGARGVTHIFGIPGVHNQELYRGLPGSGITHILARHEQGAGFMADGFARATGRPGVAYVITGPGLLNILTPLGQAYSDSVPVLAISSALDDRAGRKGQLHQMLDQQVAGSTVTSASDEALSPDAAFTLVERAFAAFALDRPRPRHIQIPIRVLEGQANAAPPPENPPERPGATGKVAEVAKLINASQRPLFILGGGACFEGANTAFAELVERTGAAVFTSYAGRGLIAPGHPRSFGSFLGQDGSVAEITRADLVVVIGSELSECDLWRAQLGHNAPMIRIDIDPTVLADHHRAQTTVQADAKAFVTALLAQIETRQGSPMWTEDEVRSARTRWIARANADYPGIQPIIDALRVSIPPDTMIFSDMTQFAYAAKELWDMPAPGLWHHPTGFGTLGYGLPAAIGGKVGRGRAPVMAIAGDYGLQFTLNELATAVELGLSLPILVWDNDALGAIADSMTSAQIAPNAVTARNPDFLALARAYGANCDQPKDLDALGRAVNAAFAADRPTLIRMTPDMVG